MAATKKKVVSSLKKKVPVKDEAANKEKLPSAERKKCWAPLRKSKVRQVKHQIRVIKQKGGTLRFARKLRVIRKISDRKRAVENKRVLKKQKAIKRKAAIEKVQGKKTKDGKSVRAVLKPEHKYDIKKMRKFYKTQLAPRRLPSKNFFSDMNTHRRRRIAYLRRSLLPGTVCILLAGRYKCKRVVFIKQLQRSGLCLVSGPFGVNEVPLRRVHQNYMIATSLRINFADVKIPKHINDSYFKREKAPKKKSSTEEEIFETKKKAKKGLSEQRKKDQKEVDRQIARAIKQRKDKKVLLKYLRTDFGLMGNRYAHKMNF